MLRDGFGCVDEVLGEDDTPWMIEGLYIHSSMDIVEKTLVGLGARIHHDILAKELVGSGILVVQFQNQNSTTLVDPSDTGLFQKAVFCPEFWQWLLFGQLLSVQIQTRVIYYFMTHAFYPPPSIGRAYACWEDGRLIECMSSSSSWYRNESSDDSIDFPERNSMHDFDFVTPFQPYLFFSRAQPEILPHEIQDAHAHMQSFLIKQEVPVFKNLKGCQAKDFERIDYACWPG